MFNNLRINFQGLWKHADFLRLWSGQTVSVFGSMVGGTAMTFTAILYLHATPFQMGVLVAMEILPAFLASLFAGAWVDRTRRRPLLIGADVGRALALATIPLAALFGVLRIEQVYLVALIASALTILFNVAYQSYLPALVGKEQLIEGNSKLTASAAIAEFGGFSLGGWLVQAFTAPLAILIDAGSFVVSALAVRAIRAAESPVQQAEQPNLQLEIVEGLKVVWGEPLLRASAAAVTILGLSGGIFGAVVVLYMSRGLGFNPGVLGMIWAIGGISSFMAAALAPRITRRAGLGRVMFTGVGLFGLAELLIPLASGATLLSAILLILQQLGDGFYVIYEINLVSLRQGIVPQRLLGRVNASLQFLALGTTLAGSLLGGQLGELVSLRTALALGGCATLLAALVIGFSPLGGLKQVPETEIISAKSGLNEQ